MNKPNKDRHAYTLLSGDQVPLGRMGEPELTYLEDLKSRTKTSAGGDYFELLREVRGPDSRVLADFGGVVTPGAAQTVFFKVAIDIVERLGVAQGRVLDSKAIGMPRGARVLGLTEAAKLIGKSRQAIHVALQKGKIYGWRVGSAWIVDLDSALEYKKSRP